MVREIQGILQFLRRPTASALSEGSEYKLSRYFSSIDQSIFDMDPAQEKILVECVTTHLKTPLDFIVQGIGSRRYNNGKNFHGSFQNSKRDGYGVLYDTESRVEYDGFWKNDKREGTGTFTDHMLNISYKGKCYI